MQQSLRVLLVEDDWSVREAVSDYLIKHGMLVSEANCLEAALAMPDDAQLDVAVVDIVLPERAGERADFAQHVGIKAARQLKAQFPGMGIVFLSAYMDRGPEVIQLFMEGHDRIAYLLKGSKPSELLDAVRKVAGGLSALEIAAGVQTARNTALDLALETLSIEEQACIEIALGNLELLSEPEWRVFEIVGACRTYQQAAKELNLSARTIGSHIEAIYEKLQLREAGSGLRQLALLSKIHLLRCLQQQVQAGN